MRQLKDMVERLLTVGNMWGLLVLRWGTGPRPRREAWQLSVYERVNLTMWYLNVYLLQKDMVERHEAKHFKRDGEASLGPAQRASSGVPLSVVLFSRLVKPFRSIKYASPELAHWRYVIR